MLIDSGVIAHCVRTLREYIADERMVSAVFILVWNSTGHSRSILLLFTGRSSQFFDNSFSLQRSCETHFSNLAVCRSSSKQRSAMPRAIVSST